MISSIATRVTTTQLSQQLNALMEMLMKADFIAQNSVTNYQKTVENNINWLTVNLADIQQIINDDIVTVPTTTSMSTTTSTQSTTTEMPQTTTDAADSIVLSSIVVLCSIVMKFLM